jgi:hypothetical protein
MPGGFAPRFAIEAGFLILLGVGAGIADLRPAVIVVLLAGGWLLVSLIELSAWRAAGRALVPRLMPAPEPEAEPEPEPELEVGWPIVAEEREEEPYPLRADSEVRDAEAEEYTRVIAERDSETVEEPESGTA